MATKCGKRGCEKDALNTVTFHDPFRPEIETDYRVVLCEAHTEEARQFQETDAAGLKRWLQS